MRAGLTQEKLAERTKQHRNFIGGVERGERNPSIGSIARILDALNVSWTEFGTALDSAPGEL